MKQRLVLGAAALIAILGLATFTLRGGGGGAQASAGRAVDDEWDAAKAIERNEAIESALDDGLSRETAACMIGEIEESVDLSRVHGFDMSATTGSSATAAEAEALAEALVGCGPSIDSLLAAEAPGTQSIPREYATEAECFTSAYRDGLRASYADRFRSPNAVGSHQIDILRPLQSCGVAPGLILGASEEGLLEVAALTTLEWKCLVERVAASTFARAFPFPDEPGDALARLGSSVSGDVAFCETWVDGQSVVG